MIKVYGTTWCGDTRRSRAYLNAHQIAYEWIDIDQNTEGRRFVEETNHGNRSVPTIVFEDGSILVEPSERQLAAKFPV